MDGVRGGRGSTGCEAVKVKGLGGSCWLKVDASSGWREKVTGMGED